MAGAGGIGRAAVVAIRMSLGAAAVFEALTVPATQVTTIWAASPWREDPYHTMVSVAGFTVPALALAIVVRLVAWRAPGGPDRAQQTVRAAAAMTTLVGLTMAFEWAAVVAGPPAASWGSRTAALVGGLVVTTVLTAVVTVLLARCRDQRGAAGRWRHDWLGDVALVCQKTPVLRRWANPDAAAWVRRHAMSVFLAVSVLAGSVVTAAQAIGERWTDPLLIAWLLTAETAANLAFCVISNAVAGFIARPPRTSLRRTTETSVIVGCLAVLVTIAFHDALWSAVGAGPLTPPALAALTLGAGAAASVVAAAVLVRLRRSGVRQN